MASSRKSQQSPKLGKRIAVALSGGLDSVVLLDTVCKAQANASNQNKNQIYAFHIHHGLQKPADEWLIFCEKLAKQYKIHFDFRLLHLNAEEAQGNIEARARAGRYEALTDLCEEYGIEDLLLAHHQNDQAETVLLQLLRGSGVAGLSGMPSSRKITTQGQSHQGITLWRPLLDQSRQELEAYAKEHKLKWIEDPSNQDTKYRRNAVRKKIIPALEKIQPEALANMARSANLLGEAQTLLNRLAQQDGKTILNQDKLKVLPLLTLAKDDLPAANNVLRYWLQTQHLAMPSQERLQAWWRDLAKVKADANLEWQHDERKIYLWRGVLQVANIEAGRWVLKTLAANSKKLGLPADWVTEAQKNQQIHLKERLGSERIQIKPKTPRKTLKNLFQEADVPPWERHAPLLFINDELVAVAGIGLSYPLLTSTGRRVLPEWVQNPVK